MKLKKKIASREFISQLSDWEVISSFSYCNMILKRETLFSAIEFESICFFFFDGDEDATYEVLEETRSLYLLEYSKRHAN